MERVPEIYKQFHEALIYSHMPSRNPKFAVEKTKTRATSPVRVFGLYFAMPTKSRIQFYVTTNYPSITIYKNYPFITIYKNYRFCKVDFKNYVCVKFKFDIIAFTRCNTILIPFVWRIALTDLFADFRPPPPPTQQQGQITSCAHARSHVFGV